MLWGKASNHFCGDGLERGADLTVFKSLHAKLVKDGSYSDAALLCCIVSGGTWPEARLQDAGYLTDGMCPRCGVARETTLHRVWGCSSNDQIDSVHLLRSRELVQTALHDEHERSAFWNRGIPTPAAAVAPLPPPMDVKQAWGLFSDGRVVRGGRFGLDGSGGKWAKDHRLRRCGWAVVRLDEASVDDFEFRCDAILAGTLPTRTQSSPRSELFALIMLLTFTTGD
eukprot:939475-Pyramimonas_sp.AAC.1